MSKLDCNTCFETTEFTQDHFDNLTKAECKTTSSECYVEKNCPSEENGNCTFKVDLPCCQCKINKCQNFR